ncbi:DUF423 domain-containing protein [Roseococcus sp. SYP-B2431]|uniref:DUF423 domain-containing protein n=1 Tax=Roseococcus sp. SYP-B2431 TaxID=2496640 RepID=UPI00103EB238|nr:DUF423 domain-containing protein [Roseococcus sp. SYP-B2431]TCH97250.1 DUF423 domain-containing protein [Roseococcus sp. SYP-B2431]
MQRLCFSLAGVFGLAAVGLAAIGAHLPMDAPEMVRSVAMLLGWHAPALIGLGLWNRRQGFLVAGVLALGMILFAGAVLFRAFGGTSLGPVAPAGGMVLMAGWALLALLAWRR